MNNSPKKSPRWTHIPIASLVRAGVGLAIMREDEATALAAQCGDLVLVVTTRQNH